MSYKDLKRVTVGCIDCGWTGRRLYHPCGIRGQQYGRCGRCGHMDLLVPIARFRELDASNRVAYEPIDDPRLIVAEVRPLGPKFGPKGQA